MDQHPEFLIFLSIFLSQIFMDLKIYSQIIFTFSFFEPIFFLNFYRFFDFLFHNQIPKTPNTEKNISSHKIKTN